MWTWAKKFWWALALAGILVYFGAREYFRALARSSAIERQLKREGDLNRKLQETAHYRTEQRARIREEIKDSRKALEVRKRELEEQVILDNDVVADYWNRVFKNPRK
jgi:biopolymer transport protein ExbB/TolQ